MTDLDNNACTAEGILAQVKRVQSSYFQWLCAIIEANDRSEGYYLLAKDLFAKEFFGTVPNDENRASDGLELRATFAANETETELEEKLTLDILAGPCSVLEMIIALASRINFILSDGDKDNTCDIFWELVGNLGLDDFSDNVYYQRGGSNAVNCALNTLLLRKYDRRGFGGLVPLPKTKVDQREVEIWYQMSAYLDENKRITD